MIKKKVRFLFIGICLAFFVCSCIDVPLKEIDSLPEPAISISELSFSLPLSFQLWDRNNSITVTPVHDKYLGSCIKKKVPHVSIIWYKSMNGRTKAYVDSA